MQTCHLGPVTVGGGAPVRLMGVINCSPESFFPGSFVPERQIGRRVDEMIAEGADIIDVGARSTAPGSPPLSVADEKDRIRRALAAIGDAGIPLTVDTMHPGVLEVCLRYEISAVNDISGLSNPDYARMVADAGIPAIAMAAIRLPGDAVGFAATIDALGRVVRRAEEAAIRELILDPGVGRWTPERTFEDDWELCRRFSRFLEFNRPILAAVSRKSFIGDLTGREPEERLAGSLAVSCALLAQGASVVRAHDVRETKDAIRVFEKIRGSG